MLSTDGSLKPALTGLAGASIEWYDFFIYATAAALVFPNVFFAAQLPPFVALIASYSTFAVGFIARPVGALLFGHLGDKLGRKTALAGALVLMGTATTLVGLLPSYATAGALAPLALVVLRLMQGLAVGGQWGGAILLATENAPKSRRGLYGSIAQAGVPVGVVLANLAFLAANGAMSAESFMSYGWRIPFLLSVLLIGLGLYIHFCVDETRAFRELRQSDVPPDVPEKESEDNRSGRPNTELTRVSPIIEALRRHPRLILLAAGAYMSTNLYFYILITYVVSYGTSATGLHLPRAAMLSAVVISSALSTPVLFLAGRLSDRYGRRRIFMAGISFATLWAFAIFPLVDTRSWPWIIVAILVGKCLTSVCYGPMAAMFTELFSTEIRCSGVSLSYQLGAIVGGGLAPIIATALFARFHSNLWVSFYMAGACAISLICANKLGDAHGADLDRPMVTAASTLSA
jgi:MFS family permease